MIHPKVRRTFIAMFWGWVVCNVITFLAFSLWSINSAGSLSDSLQFVLLFTLISSIYSGIAITAAWLLALVPTDFLVNDASFLRKPRNAAVCGAAGGFMSIVLLKFVLWAASPNPVSANKEDYIALIMAGALAAITAALHIVLKHPRLQPPNKF